MMVSRITVQKVLVRFLTVESSVSMKKHVVPPIVELVE